ncbi:MAG: F0F1 ATP synthase subunit A [Proteobacteria bacterium]|nr:F0F1 ATP synthase subunit A [Pseudomonadota bacterium]MBU1449531.1 F0F1 ATP synthase subunit A [Pseudomonadota bacterium]MBU2467022.1 F0F1 ATP synthase subunit A [Pseudomonadota bacterium]MBU2517605.1 F0F1 ATP synthase subunit A [Pseudomonadota bacterium]
MEHPLLLLGLLLDSVGLGGFVHHYPHVVYSWLIILFLLVAAKLAVGTVKMVPTGGQNFFEVLVGGFEDFAIDVMGEHGRPFYPLIATLFIYILCMNWIGLVPGMLSPTSNINTPLSMALVVFVFYNFIGIKVHGVSYIKHFMGPIWWLAPLMLPIELIGHFSRILSLTFRLFGNVLGEDLVLAILFVLAGMFFAPLPMMFLAIFTSFVQAFIFSLLTMLYIAGSLEESH